LAETVIAEAARISRTRVAAKFGEPSGSFAIFGLGKFGGREIGYASDLELLFVHQGKNEFFEALAHQVAGFIDARSHGVFHIDLRLRSHGDGEAWFTRS